MALGYSQLEFISREMASLVRAKIPLPDGLRQLAASAQSGRLREAYMQLASTMEQGRPLSAALTAAAAPPEFVAAIVCAETSGDMASVLEFAIEHCRRVDFFYGKLTNIVLYPAIVASIAIAIVTLLLMFIVPRFQDIFALLGGQLPEPTQIMLQLSRMLQHGGGIAVLTLTALFFAWICSPLFSRQMPFFLQRLPFFGQLLMLSDMAMLMRFFDRMLGRGLPLPAVLRAASLAVWGRTLRSRLLLMAIQAEQGMTVFGCLAGVIPPLPLHLLQQAEQRGDLVETCPGVAEYCEERFGLRAESQLQLMEPLIIFFLGGILGGIIISLYLPLFNIPRMIGR